MAISKEKKGERVSTTHGRGVEQMTHRQLLEWVRFSDLSRSVCRRALEHPLVAQNKDSLSFSILLVLATRWPEDVLRSGHMQFAMTVGEKAALPTLLEIARSTASVDTIREVFYGSFDMASDEFLSSLARNRLCPSDILEKLSRHPSPHVRDAVASNNSCGVDVLEELAEDDDQYVRATVARNANVSTGMLKELIVDTSVYVRFSVYGNKRTPKEFLEKYSAKDPAAIGVAGNEDAPLGMLLNVLNQQMPRHIMSIFLAKTQNNVPVDCDSDSQVLE